MIALRNDRMLGNLSTFCPPTLVALPMPKLPVIAVDCVLPGMQLVSRLLTWLPELMKGKVRET